MDVKTMGFRDHKANSLLKEKYIDLLGGCYP